MSNFISNEKIVILDVMDDGPSIKLLGMLQSREYSQRMKEKVHECVTTQELGRLPVSQVTIGTIALAQINPKSNSCYYRVQIIDNKNWNSGILMVLLIDEFRWNFNIPFVQLFSAPSNILELPLCSETFYLADVSPLCLNTWSDNCINVLKGQLISKAVNGTVFRERGKIALFRPYEPNDQGQLLAKTLVQCGMAYITPSFPGLSPFPTTQNSSHVTNKFVENSFLYAPEQYVPTMISAPSLAYPLVPVVPYACIQSGNTAPNNISMPNITGGNFSTVATNNYITQAPSTYVEKKNKNFSKPSLQPGFQDKCRVTYIENGPWKFCIKLKCQQFFENNLEKEIQKVVSGNLVSISTVERGMSVLCKSNNKYYRGLIIGIDDFAEGKLQVFLIDHGSEEDVHISSIWSVPPNLYDIPMLVNRCCLQGLPKSFVAQISKNFKDLVTNEILNCTIGSETPDLLLSVDLEIGSYSVIDVVTFSTYKKESIKSGDEVIICHINGEDGLTFLHLAKNLAHIDTLQSDIYNESKMANMLTKPHKGLPCLAMYTEDMNWYRGIIVDSLYGAMKVRYVDYGNEEEHTKPHNIKEIKDSMLTTLPSQAIPCFLEGLEDKMVDAAELLNRVEGKPLIVTVVDEVKSYMNGIPIKLPKVKLLDTKRQRYINEELVQLGNKSPVKIKKTAVHFADEVSVYTPRSDSNLIEQTSGNKNSKVGEVPIVPDWLKVCKVSHVESQSLFYVNLIQHENVKKVINETLKGSFGLASDQHNRSFVIGDHVMVASSNSPDCSYYRGVIVACTNDSFTLNLVDLGMEQTAFLNQIKPLPLDISLARHPPQAVKCGLENVPHSAGTEREFMNHVAKQPVNVHFIRKERDSWKVSILRTSDMMADVNRVNYSESKFKFNKLNTEKDCERKSDRPNWREKDSVEDATDGENLSWRSSRSGSSDRSPRNSIRNNNNNDNEDDVWRPWNKMNSSSPQESKYNSVDVVDNRISAANSARQNLSNSWNDNPKSSNLKDKFEEKYIEQPPLSSTESVFVTYVDEDSELVWVQRKSDTSALEKLNLDIENEIASGTVKQFLSSISKGYLCLAQSNEDELWYRGRVVSADGDNIKVHYVDFGNSEELQRSRVRELSNQFCKPHELCYSCVLQAQHLDLINNASEEAHELVLNILSREGNKYTVNFVENVNDVENNNQPNDSLNINADELNNVDKEKSHTKIEQIPIFVTETEVEPITCSENIENRSDKNSDDPTIGDVSPPLGVPSSLFISYIEEDGTLWVQLGSNSTFIDELMDTLASLIDNECNLSNIEVGVICSGKYSVDEGWYRAKVVSVDFEKQECQVKFLDYGNSETISFNDIKVLSKECRNLPAQGIHCSLFSEEYNCLLKGSEIRSSLEKFNETMLEGIFEKSDNSELILRNALIDGESLEAKVLSEVGLAIGKSPDEFDFYFRNEYVPVSAASKSKHHNIIQHFDLNGTTVESGSVLIPSPTSEEKSENVFKTGDLLICSVEDNKNVWVQDKSRMVEGIDLLNNIEAYVKMETGSLSDAQVGEICICLPAEHQTYHRAKVLKVLENSIQVRDVDSGNKFEVPLTRIFPSSPELMLVPFQAIKCSFKALDDCHEDLSSSVIKYMSNKKLIKGRIKSNKNGNTLIDVSVDEVSLISLKDSFEKGLIRVEDGCDKLANVGIDKDQPNVDTKENAKDLNLINNVCEGDKVHFEKNEDNSKIIENMHEDKKYVEKNTEVMKVVDNVCGVEVKFFYQTVENRYVDEAKMEKFAQPIATEILEKVNAVVSSLTLINDDGQQNATDRLLIESLVKDPNQDSVLISNMQSTNSSEDSTIESLTSISILTDAESYDVLQSLNNKIGDNISEESKEIAVSDLEFGIKFTESGNIADISIPIAEVEAFKQSLDDQNLEKLALNDTENTTDDLMSFENGETTNSYDEENIKEAVINDNLEMEYSNDLTTGEVRKLKDIVQKFLDNSGSGNPKISYDNSDVDANYVNPEIIIFGNDANPDHSESIIEIPNKETNSLNLKDNELESSSGCILDYDIVKNDDVDGCNKISYEDEYLSSEVSDVDSNVKQEGDTEILNYNTNCKMFSVDTEGTRVYLNDIKNNSKELNVQDNFDVTKSTENNLKDDVVNLIEEDAVNFKFDVKYIDKIYEVINNEETQDVNSDDTTANPTVCSSMIESAAILTDENTMSNPQTSCEMVESTHVATSVDSIINLEDKSISTEENNGEKLLMVVDEDLNNVEAFTGIVDELNIVTAKPDQICIEMFDSNLTEKKESECPELNNMEDGFSKLNFNYSKVDQLEYSEETHLLCKTNLNCSEVDQLDSSDEAQLLRQDIYENEIVSLKSNKSDILFPEEREPLLNAEENSTDLDDDQTHLSGNSQEEAAFLLPGYDESKSNSFVKEENLTNTAELLNHDDEIISYKNKTIAESFDNEGLRNYKFPAAMCEKECLIKDSSYDCAEDSFTEARSSNIGTWTSDEEFENIANLLEKSLTVSPPQYTSDSLEDASRIREKTPMCMAFKNIERKNSSISIVQLKNGIEDGNSLDIEEMYEIITDEDREKNASNNNQEICSDFVETNSGNTDDLAPSLNIEEESKFHSDELLFNLSTDFLESCNQYTFFDKDESLYATIDSEVLKEESFDVTDMKTTFPCASDELAEISNEAVNLDFCTDIAKDDKLEKHHDSDVQIASEMNDIISLGKIVEVGSNPLCVWIIKDDDSSHLNKIELEMKKAVEKELEVPNDIHIGHLYASYYCGNLLRAKVTSIEDSTLKIFFVDIGKRCNVNVDELYDCPQSLLTIPPLAYFYQLPVHFEEENIPKIVRLITNRCLNQCCAFNDVTTFLRPSVKTQCRQAIISSKHMGSITDYIVSKGLATNYSYNEVLHSELLNELSYFTQVVLEEGKKF